MYRARLFLAFAVAVVLWPATAGADVTTFSYTGGEQTYVVPAGVHGLSVTAIGAPGGGPVSGGLAAGRGAVVSGVVDVTPGQVLYVEVGGTGGSPIGGFNGGGVSGVRNNIHVSRRGRRFRCPYAADEHWRDFVAFEADRCGRRRRLGFPGGCRR